MAVNDDLLDDWLQHQVYLTRYTTGQLKDLQRFLQELQDDVSSVLGKRLADVTTSGTVNTQRLKALLKELQDVGGSVAAQMQEAQRLQLKALASYESGWTLTTLDSRIPVQVDLASVSDAQLWAAVTARPFEGRHLEQWFTDYTTTQQARITAAVRMSVIEGETVDQTIRRIRGTRAVGYTDGLIQGITRRSAEALTRTAIAHVAQTARQATFDANPDVLQGVQWHSVLDGRTSPICRARDGTLYPLSDGPRPPAHPNCRSTMVPVTKTWQQLGLELKDTPAKARASMNGQVPAALTYQTWLEKQPAAFQDDVLGPTRAKLFRQGGLTLDQFVDERSGDGYTLDQLRQLHPDAFEAAQL